MKEQIKSLIEKGEIREALQFAAQTIDAVVILKARYNNTEREFNLGLISYQDFVNRTTRYTNALLDLIPDAPVFSPGYMQVTKNKVSKFVGVGSDIELVLVSKKNARLISDPIAWRVTEDYYKTQGYKVTVKYPKESLPIS